MKTIIAAIVCSVLGVLSGWYFTKPAPVIETPAVQQIQSDGSTVLERQPDSKAKPRHRTPAGAKVERVGSVTVQGETPKEFFACSKDAQCPPVTIDTSLVRLDDGSKRVIVSSPDGRVLRGIDIPVETAGQIDAHRWAMGASYDPIHRAAGLWVERDVGRMRLGLDINQRDQVPSRDVEYRVRVGWTF